VEGARGRGSERSSEKPKRVGRRASWGAVSYIGQLDTPVWRDWNVVWVPPVGICSSSSPRRLCMDQVYLQPRCCCGFHSAFGGGTASENCAFHNPLEPWTRCLEYAPVGPTVTRLGRRHGVCRWGQQRPAGGVRQRWAVLFVPRLLFSASCGSPNNWRLMRFSSSTLILQIYTIITFSNIV
jgi:hypothetical protein